MAALHKTDLQWVLKRTPVEILKQLQANANRVFVAGGFIRSCIANEQVNDIDLFVPSREVAINLANELALDKSQPKKLNGVYPGIYLTDNALTIKAEPSIQIIHKWVFSDPNECIASFDFTIAQAAFWWRGDVWASACCDTYYSDLAAKRLVYTSPKRIEEVGGSMLRVLRFYQRGYRIPLESLSAVIARVISGIDMNKTGNVEKENAHVMTGLLYEVDPSIDPNHIAHL